MDDLGETDPILATRDTFSEIRSISNGISSNLNRRTDTVMGKAVKGGFLSGGISGICGGSFLGGIGLLCFTGNYDIAGGILLIFGGGFFICGVVSTLAGIAIPKNLRC